MYGVQALQVILAAIEKSDGTRAGVNRAVFTDGGVQVPSVRSALGADVTINPATGDVGLVDVTVLQVVSGGAESFRTLVHLA